MKRLCYAPNLLGQAAETLQAEGFTVQAAPLELLTHGCILVAWHPARSEGFLIEPAELGAVARLGSSYLDPHADSTLPRWQRDGTPDTLRMRRYAEAVLARACAEAASAPEGIRNQTLNRVAWVVGRYLGWGLDPASVQAELEEAGRLSGLGEREIEATVRRALERGAQAPRDPEELLHAEQGSSVNPSPSASAKPHLANKTTYKGTSWSVSSPWSRG